MQLLEVNNKTLNRMKNCDNWEDYLFKYEVVESLDDNECICEYYMNSLDKCSIIFKKGEISEIFEIKLKNKSWS